MPCDFTLSASEQELNDPDQFAAAVQRFLDDRCLSDPGQPFRVSDRYPFAAAVDDPGPAEVAEDSAYGFDFCAGHVGDVLPRQGHLDQNPFPFVLATFFGEME